LNKASSVGWLVRREPVDKNNSFDAQNTVNMDCYELGSNWGNFFRPILYWT
jgi:hypothetical protein